MRSRGERSHCSGAGCSDTVHPGLFVERGARITSAQCHSIRPQAGTWQSNALLKSSIMARASGGITCCISLRKWCGLNMISYWYYIVVNVLAVHLNCRENVVLSILQFAELRLQDTNFTDKNGTLKSAKRCEPRLSKIRIWADWTLV